MTGLSTSPKTRKSQVARSVLRDAAGVQHRPLLGQVLARRKASRVVARIARPSSRLGSGTSATYTSHVDSPGTRSCRRPRSFVRVAGPDAADFLERMVSNEVASLAAGESRDALLLTPKARVIAPLRVLRRGRRRLPAADGARARRRRPLELLRARFAAKCEIEPEEQRRQSCSATARGSRLPTTAMPAREVLDAGEADGDVGRAGAAADRGGHAALRPRDRRPRAPGRGGPGRARGLVHEGLLPGPGADRAPPVPRARPTGGCGCSSSRPTMRRRPTPSSARREGGRPDDELGPEGWRSDTCGRGGGRRRPRGGGTARESAPGKIRTCDLCLRRAALYPLSYGRQRRPSVAAVRSARRRGP